MRKKEEAVRVKYTMFADGAGGSWYRLFYCVDFPGISGKIWSDKRQGNCGKVFYYKGEIYSSASQAIDLWRNENGKTL